MSEGSGDPVREAIEALTPLQGRLLDTASARQHLRRRQRELGLGSSEAFAVRLRSDRLERERVVAAVAVPETWFFRYRQSFELLRSRLAERRSRGGSLRMLSAPCATGQEPISMVVTALAAGWRAEQVVVEAIDASSAAIDRALRSGREPLPLREALPPWASPWLAAGESGVAVDPRVLERIRFEHADLFEWSPARGEFEVVFCRNFFIYLRPEARREALSRCGRWLSRDGLLFVGHADHDARAIEGFRPVGVPQTFAYERAPLPAAASMPAPAPQAPARKARATPVPQAASPKHRAAPAPAPARPGAAPPAVARAGEPPLPEELSAIRAIADAGRTTEAAALAERWVRERGPMPEAIELLGCIRLAAGDREGAWEWFRRLVYLEPGHESGLLHLAMLSEHGGDLAAAARYRERAQRAAAESDGGGAA